MKKIVYLLLLLCGLILFASCGSTVPDTTMAAVTTEEVPNATTPITTVPTTTPVTTTETPTTTEASDDKWKEKVDWTNKDAAGVYDAETDTYAIGITVRDIHSVGQKNANEAFAETYGFEYKYPVSTYLFQKRATMEEIEMFARLEEVESVVFSLPPVFS